MARFIIRGGHPIRGTHRPCGNKNAALPMLAAALLTDEPVCLSGLPRIDDVDGMLEILHDLGAHVERRGHTVEIQARSLRKTRLRDDLCKKMRSSILFAGPLVARYGTATLFPPGGDVIGRRRLDTHFQALACLGVQIRGNHRFALRRTRLTAADILLDEASVTATENAIMAAVLAPGMTTIRNAACEPHVQALCHFLNRMGARIRGIGTNQLRIRGVNTLHGTRARIPPDHIDVGTFIAAAAVTRGSLHIPEIPADLLRIAAPTFKKLGVRWRTRPRGLYLPARQKLVIQPDFGGAIPKIEDGVWPAFPSDLMSLALVLATQCTGTVLFFEKLFESRLYFVDRLIAMGARIVLCDPHRAIVTGPSVLRAIHMASPDIRAGAALVVAALAARGVSVIENADSIDRGYERLDEELRRLGADIERVS